MYYRSSVYLAKKWSKSLFGTVMIIMDACHFGVHAVGYCEYTVCTCRLQGLPAVNNHGSSVEVHLTANPLDKLEHHVNVAGNPKVRPGREVELPAQPSHRHFDFLLHVVQARQMHSKQCSLSLI